MKTKTIMAFVVLAAGVVTSVFGNTYYLTKESNTRGNLKTAADWADANGVSPTYAPTSQSCDPNDTYVVKDERRTRDNAAGTGNMNIYGRIVYGEVDGTTGEHYEESHYSRTSTAKLNFCHADGATLANGSYIAGNGTTDSTYGNRVMGKITVVSPVDAPFVFKTSNTTNGRYIYFENSFSAEEGAGLKFAETGCAYWQFKGSLTDYKGAMTFTKSGTRILFGADCGTVQMSALSFTSSMTVNVQNVSAPITAKSLSVGDGACFKLSSKTVDDTVQVASLACDQAAIGGTIRLVVEEFEEPTVSQGGVLKLVLFKSNQGGLALENFDVDLGASALLPAFKGLKIETVGTAQSLVAVFSYSVDTAYHLTAESSSDAKNLMDADAWVRLDDTVAPCAPTDEAATNYAYVVDEGRIAKGSNNGYSGSPETISASNFTVGAVGGSAGTLITYSQYQTSPLNLNAAETVFANGTLQFQGADGRTGRVTGAATVLAPFDAPFKIYMWNAPTIEFDVALTAEAGRGILIYERSACTGCAKFKMLGDLSNYHGSIKFDDARVLYTLGAETGTLDMDELVFDAGVTVTVSNVSSPLKASKMTFGDGAVINLAATSTDGKVSAARLVAGSLAVTGKPHIVIPDLPRFAGGLVLPLVTVAEGDLSTDTFDVAISCPRMDKFEGFVVLDEMDGGKTLAAKFRNPGAILNLK